VNPIQWIADLIQAPKRRQIAFDHVVLGVIDDFYGHGYGVPILKELTHRTGRFISIGELYTAFDRLEQAGLVTSREGDPTAERGWRPRRYYTITKAGVDWWNTHRAEENTPDD
jgi:DNA-binding PadR family transcriptional regulator